jgi:hypothetical protein
MSEKYCIDKVCTYVRSSSRNAIVIIIIIIIIIIIVYNVEVFTIASINT